MLRPYAAATGRKGPYKAKKGHGSEDPPRQLFAGGRGGSAATGVFRSGEVAGDLAFADFEDDDFVRRGARTTLHVELHGLAGSFIFFLDRLVVGENGHGVFGFFLIGLVESD